MPFVIPKRLKSVIKLYLKGLMDRCRNHSFTHCPLEYLEHAFHLFVDVLVVPTVNTEPPIAISTTLQDPKLTSRHCVE